MWLVTVAVESTVLGERLVQVAVGRGFLVYLCVIAPRGLWGRGPDSPGGLSPRLHSGSVSKNRAEAVSVL